jgi:hypothetical protein
VVEAGQTPPVRQPAASVRQPAAAEDPRPGAQPQPDESPPEESDSAQAELRPPHSRAALWFFLGVCVGAFPSLAVLLYIVVTMPKGTALPARHQTSPMTGPLAVDPESPRVAPLPSAEPKPDPVEIERIPPSHQFIPPGLRQKRSAAPSQRSGAGGTPKPSREEEYERPKRPLQRVPVDDPKADDDVQVPARRGNQKPP